MNEIIAKINSFHLTDYFGTAPYEYLYNLQGSPFETSQALLYMTQHSKDVGYKHFSRTYTKYIDSIKSVDDYPKTDYSGNYTAFSDQLLKLACGEWQTSDAGIFRIRRNGHPDYACYHPVTISAVLIDLESGETKIELAYCVPGKTNGWETQVVDATTIGNARSILTLSTYGIDITTSNATLLVDYLRDLRVNNYTIIPVKRCFSQLGYHHGIGFAPFVDGLVFGARSEYRKLYNSIRAEGSYDTWLETALHCRTQSLAVRVMLAGAFASVLVHVLHVLPFFIHLWGHSGTGKSIALALAASVFGNPEHDAYMQSFNSTLVAMERTSSFLRHLPYCMDELQLSRNKDVAAIIYQLTQGVSRSRGQKENGGIQTTLGWANCFLTTGESPIASIASGSGTVNRVIDLACPSTKQLFDDPSHVLMTLLENYGHAGQDFLTQFSADPHGAQYARYAYDDAVAEFRNHGVTGKQAMAAATIIAADELATRYIFRDKRALKEEDLLSFLARESDISVGAAGYSAICDWVITDSRHFEAQPEHCQQYGIRDGRLVSILPSVFREKMSSAGFDPTTVLAYLKQNHLLKLRADGDGYGASVRINKASVNCYCVYLPEDYAT